MCSFLLRLQTMVILFFLGLSAQAELPMIRTQGASWVRSDGLPVDLKGVNLGNWLMLEFWMMGQRSNAMDDQCTLEAKLDERFGYAERERLMKVFRDQWITQRDWDLITQFGLNMVRVPFIWNLLEDEKNPRHLRQDAWHYLDFAIEQARIRGLYVILDLHGAVGSQGLEHHSGCANRNLYWTTPEYQERTSWLWTQIAERYKGNSVVAGYGLLNEPWGTSETQLAEVMKALYRTVRAADPDHVIILPGHVKGIDAYGKPADSDMHNVAFEMHFYPGHFGWGKPGVAVQQDWLQCRPRGTGLCSWRARMNKLQTPMFVGEFQPWADLGNEAGGKMTRASFDAYASAGWASALWSYKMVTANGGQMAGNWGLVTNKLGAPIPFVDFATAPKEEIELFFKQMGTVPYAPHKEVKKWMNQGRSQR